MFSLRLKFKVMFSFGLLILLAGILLALSPESRRSVAPLVGAYYYSWFPENWSHGYAYGSLKPPFHALLGEYSSDDSEVFSRHLDWAFTSGIDFFVLDWWPNRPWVRKNFERVLSEVEFPLGFSFAIHYETLDLDANPQTSHNNVIELNDRRVSRLASHWESIAKSYMRDPRYLRIDNHPVLFVYATRHLIGNVADGVKKAREHVRKTTGLSLYLVGDEVYFNVITKAKDGTAILLPKFEPEWDRLRAFDAVTVYNPYDEFQTEHAGCQGQDKFISDVKELYSKYRKISSSVGIPFFPTVIPAYNDRAVRPKEDHFILPREGLFERLLLDAVSPNLNSETPVAMITSWNEWNEGTQIEPTAGTSCTVEDNSDSGKLITLGISHCAYGHFYLSLIKAWKEGLI